jgi:hypothetical protein
MNKLLLTILLLFSSCKSVVVQKNQPIPQQVQQVSDSNKTILGIGEPDVNIFNADYFSPSQVFLVLLFIIFALCFISFSPHILKFLKKKRS